MVRETGNAFANAYKYIKEQNEAEAAKAHAAVVEAAKAHESAVDRIYNLREARETNRRNHNKLLEDCKNDALSTIIKAIYIEALVPGALTDDALFLAENMVDGWIKEKGGASNIIGACKNRSYLLNRICTIAEEVAYRNVQEIEALDFNGIPLKEQEEAEEEKKAKVTQMLAQANALIAKATALQNGDDSATEDEDDTDTSTKEPATTDSAESGSDAVDISQPVEGEEEAPAEEDKDNGDPDLGDIPEDEEASAEKEAPAEEPKAEDEKEEESSEEKEEEKTEEEAPAEEDKEGEESEEGEEEESDSDAEEEVEFDDDSEDSGDDDMGDPDYGDMEAGEEEDQQDAEAELTGESLDDEDVEEEDEDEVEDTSVDGENSEPEGKIFEELDKEEDVKKAVELIRQRVADAEEDFVKRNAEDKKKIDDLLGKISDNIKTVEDLSDDDSIEGQAKKDIAQESTMMLRRKIKNITENRPQSVFERMARKLTEGITKDSDIRAMYLAEGGRMDVAAVIESTRVMYGFLEALRTLQLEKVDSAYIENVLKEM